MEINDLFRIGISTYKVMDNPEGRCTNCAAFLNEKLCFKMPDCGVRPNDASVYFKRMNPYELRQAKKQKINIQIL